MYAPQREERELKTVPPASPSSKSSVRNVARCQRQIVFPIRSTNGIEPNPGTKIEPTSPRCCVATDGVNVVPFVRHSSRHRVRKTAVEQGAPDIVAAMAVHRGAPIGSSFPRCPGKNASSRRGRRIGGAMHILAKERPPWLGLSRRKYHYQASVLPLHHYQQAGDAVERRDGVRPFLREYLAEGIRRLRSRVGESRPITRQLCV